MENQSTPPVDADDAQTAESQPVEPNKANETAHAVQPEIEATAVPARTSRVGRWVLILLATLVVGFGAAFFALYLPASQELRQVKGDLTAAQEKLTTAESDLDNTTSDLNAATAELKAARYNRALAQVEANVAYARLALVTRDLLTARQEVSAAAENMTALLPLIEDQETAKALEDRMTGIRTAIDTDSTKALDELRTLSENLLRLESR